LLGVATNREFLLDALTTEEFASGSATTAFIGKHYGDGFQASEADPAAISLAAILVADKAGTGWASNAVQAHPITLASEGQSTTLRVARSESHWSVEAGGNCVSLAIIDRRDGFVRFELDGLMRRAAYLLDADGSKSIWTDGSISLRILPIRRSPSLLRAATACCARR
jgi:geranyl-CoA carboxylase alpha subunit